MMAPSSLTRPYCSHPDGTLGGDVGPNPSPRER